MGKKSRGKKERRQQSLSREKGKARPRLPEVSPGSPRRTRWRWFRNTLVAGILGVFTVIAADILFPVVRRHILPPKLEYYDLGPGTCTHCKFDMAVVPKGSGHPIRLHLQGRMYIHLARFIAVNDTVRISDAHFIQGDPKAYNLYGDNLRGNLIFIRIRGDMLLKTRQVSMAWALMANQLLEYGRRLAHAAYGNDAEVIIPKEFEGYERDWRDLEQRVAALPIVIERDHPVSLAVVASPDLYVGERPYLNPDSPAGSPSEVSDQLSRADEIENMVAKTQAHFEYHTDSGQGVSVPVSIKPPVPLRLELGTAKE